MQNFTTDITQCLEILQNGGIILYPTDTIWGLGCDATNEAAIEKIITLKKRAPSKSFVVLVSDEKEIMKYVAAIDLSVFDYLDSQTKPTTVIYNNALGFPDNIVAADGSIAIRICKDDFCKTLIKRFRKPIVSTSANFSNEPSPKIFKDIDNELKKGDEYIVKQRQDDTTLAEPSYIIKWENCNIISII